MNKQIIVAYGAVPKDGGTFTFYRHIRPALKEYGIDLRCVSVGKKEAGLLNAEFVDDGCVLLAPDESDVKKQAMAFGDWCETSGVDIVMAINSFAILSSLPHLPERIRVISRCANAFDHGYQITLSGRERLARIIATTPRLKKDLVNVYGADAQKIELIPNGIFPKPFDLVAGQLRGEKTPLRLGYVGRLEHNQKGVLYLPDIVSSLDKMGVDFIFRIAGKGVHKKALERKLKWHVAAGQVRFEGLLSPAGVVDFLGNTDVFVFVSLFEGCPNALLEAMMAGCAPVAYQIEGITDFIITHGKTGFVCPMGDGPEFARRITQLAKDRKRLQKMAAMAGAGARKRFSRDRAARDYAGVFHEIMRGKPPEWEPVSWSEFEPDPAFAKPGMWAHFVPRIFKQTVNNCLFHLGISNRYYE